MNDADLSEAARLEMLWRGEFGDAYVDRNQQVGDHRGPFWKELLAQYPARRVLEVGCNVGGNLRWISEVIPPQNVYGIDVNQKAIDELHRTLPGVNAVWSPGRELPFRDRWFDLTFTMGVLIHQPESTLPLVMSEIVRCSSHFILCTEYYSDETVEIPYREQTGALFKRNYRRIYEELFPELRCVTEGFLSRAEGWDDVHFWMFEKP